MAFRFRLAPVLRYRAWCEDLRALALARAGASARARAARRAALAAAERRAQEAVGRALAEGDVQTLRTVGAELDALRRAGTIAHRLLAEAEARVAEARQALVAATQARRALERIRDRQVEAYHAELERRQATALDEAAAIGWWRRSARGTP